MAMRVLGGMYKAGQGVRQNYAEARRWYEQAALLGNENAKEYLAALDRVRQGGRSSR